MRILVADDNPDCVTSLRFLLEACGHEVSTAHDGVAAVELAESIGPATVILDIGMPRLDGFAAAKRIRRDHPCAVLIAYSGYSDPEYRRRGQEFGFDYYFSKFETGALLDVVAGSPPCALCSGTPRPQAPARRQ